jgi:tetratricopeptide (TPR) repeat protein
MRTALTRWTSVLALGLLLPIPVQAQNSADRLTDDARRLVDEGSYQQALRQLERAIEADSAYPEAYFVLGYARGRLGDHAAAAEAFLAATRLRPGWGDAHRMAALAASNAAQMAVAWEQVIRARHAGIDMSQEVEVMATISPPPADFDRQMAAPRVLLVPLDLSQFEEFNDSPFAREARTGNSSVGLARGQPASVESRSLTSTETENPNATSAQWATQTGAPMIAESVADLDLMLAGLARNLGESLEIGLVRDAEHAQYDLVVEVHNVARSGTDRTGGQAVSSEPKWFQGAMVLRSRSDGSELIRHPMRLTDLRSASTVQGEIAVYVRQLSTRWLELGR